MTRLAILLGALTTLLLSIATNIGATPRHQEGMGVFEQPLRDSKHKDNELGLVTKGDLTAFTRTECNKGRLCFA